ncbi:MAG TPA: PadR family transcriptional regulator [Acidimicrobiales bacterium]|nr:PadR family transcriptional regulator [Acidimicrobiales bacterium]
MNRVFAHGGLRLFLLMLLEEEPRHGYELIRMVEDRLLGMYTPSAGTVYPRLSSLEEEGLVEHEMIDGKKVYRLTDAGRAELDARRAELSELQERAVESARLVATSIRDEVRHSVRGLREELRHAMKDARREQRWATRQARHEERANRTRGDDGGGADRLGMKALRSDLEAFVEDVEGAAASGSLSRDTLRDVRDRLLEARDAIFALLGATGEADQQTDPGEHHL